MNILEKIGVKQLSKHLVATSNHWNFHLAFTAKLIQCHQDRCQIPNSFLGFFFYQQWLFLDHLQLKPSSVHYLIFLEYGQTLASLKSQGYPWVLDCFYGLSVIVYNCYWSFCYGVMTYPFYNEFTDAPWDIESLDFFFSTLIVLLCNFFLWTVWRVSRFPFQ